MRPVIEKQIEASAKQLFKVGLEAELTRPDPSFGDYTTNICLRLAKQLNQKPKDLADTLASELSTKLRQSLSQVSVAGPGFINLTLTDSVLAQNLELQPSRSLDNKVVVCEYSDPNPFKVLHAGHVYTTVVGDAIANLMEAAGAKVHRVNYGGDVGRHVAITMWAIIKRLDGENPEKLSEVPEANRANWLAEAYVEGNNAFESDKSIEGDIKHLNKRIYQLHADNDHDSPLAKIYWTCRDWSYQAFDVFYKRLGTSMERYYPESEVAAEGLELVNQQVGKVFEKSDGAIIFNGEPYGLHTRVFVNREGLPTYEAKEVGLIFRKYDDYHFDRSIIVTANEQAQYMAVVFKAVEQFKPELVAASVYVPHGMVRLAGGTKMSSRKGNIVKATAVIDQTAEASRQLVGQDNDETVLAAIKYAFLKPRLGSDLIYDSKESVSLEGNSGPYLQYAHARAMSILAKADNKDPKAPIDIQFDPTERLLASKISEYPEVVELAINELMPHHVCTYLYELAQSFNRFYEQSKVIGDKRQDLRLALVKSYQQRLKAGLKLLGITAPNKM